jgi:hypothetical protein
MNICEEGSSISKGIKYKIESETIENYSIRYKSDECDIWTKSMKYFLHNLQWLID